MKPQKKTIVRLAQESLDERWVPISKAKSVEEMRKIENNVLCPFCERSIEMRRKYPEEKYSYCLDGYCPAKQICDTDYEIWHYACEENELDFARDKALSIVRQLHEIIEEYSQ